MSASEMMVSIVCNAYNHEKYIGQALDSFVMQKTSFPFEILVHDDASTDATAEIIREYERKYPELIKAICQTENQYSQGKKVTAEFQLPRVKGRYIAVCEGDDYWVDPDKLRKQVEAMEAHPELDICAHAGYTSKAGEYVGRIAPAQEDTILTTEQVIDGGGGYVVTSSLMYRREMLDRRPPFASLMSLDYVTQIWGSLRGGMLYLKDCMSVYRLATESSWTKRMQASTDAAVRHTQRVNEMLRALNEDTHGQYEETIRRKIARNEGSSLLMQGKYTELLKAENKHLLAEMDGRARLKIRLQALRQSVKALAKRFQGSGK